MNPQMFELLDKPPVDIMELLQAKQWVLLGPSFGAHRATAEELLIVFTNHMKKNAEINASNDIVDPRSAAGTINAGALSEASSSV